ncbi:MAG: hypothetical protein K6T75_03125 [Acetobacteraceae bacterium]|nr:hypothetical protein [Acetobacteraceae bacterium]
MVRPDAILDTLARGCADGVFVLRLVRPDRSVRTWWRQTPDDSVLKEPTLEAWLPNAASLTELDPELLSPGRLPHLWEGPQLTLGRLCDYFSQGRILKETSKGYEEPVAIPHAPREVVEAAVCAAVKQGKLWLTSGPATVLADEVPPGLLSPDAALQAPPDRISPLEILRDALPDAWQDQLTTALAVSAALSKKAGKALPWATVREAIDGALRTGLLELAPESTGWPCEAGEAGALRLRLPSEPPPARPKPQSLTAEAHLRVGQLQDLAENLPQIIKAAAGLNLKFHLRVELTADPWPTSQAVKSLNALLRQISEDLQLPEPKE